MSPLTWHADDAEPVIVLATVNVAWVLFHSFGRERNLLRFVPTQLPEAARQARAVFLERVAGFVMLGLVPAAVAALMLHGSAASYGLALGRPVPTLALLGGVMLVVVPLLRRAAADVEHRAHSPRVRAQRWSRRLLRENALTLALYLVGYEFLFRGLLLFAMADWVGAWPAVAISTLAYTWAHLHKHPEELLGSLPVGVVFGATALASGSMLGPLLAHVVIAVSADWFALRADPKVSIEGH